MEELFKNFGSMGMTKNGQTKLIYVGNIRNQSQDGQKCGKSLGLFKVLLLKSLMKVLA